MIGLAMGLLGATGGVADDSPPSSAQPSPTGARETYPAEAFAAIGSSFAESSHLPELGWNEAQISAFLDGVRAAFRGKPHVFDDTARMVSAEMAQRQKEIVARGIHESSGTSAPGGDLEHYMKEMRKRFFLQQTDDGLGYRVDPGRGGARPRPGDTIVITCTAAAADGTTKLPQLSSERARLRMADLLPGLMEGLQMMTVDAQAVFVMPPALSFGVGEWPEGVERGSPLVFSVTLHEIVTAGNTP
jgi:FKBP-type peptidyl-prolyl cis-trans isomerase